MLSKSMTKTIRRIEKEKDSDIRVELRKGYTVEIMENGLDY
jgi:hypothetical protein